jgi:glycosyltransferase involved in cell wall biosynthesis
MPEPQLSIIICTKNRAKSLEQTLHSLRRDTSESSAEVLVVDNGSSDQTPEVIRAAQAIFPVDRPVRALSCPRPGLARARNHAVPSARSELVAFTDDDVTVHSGWIDAVVRTFRDGVDVVGGRVLPLIQGTAPRWFEFRPFFAVTLWDYGPEAIELGLLDDGPGKPRRQVYPIGANMALRRSLLMSLGEPFNPRLGHTGMVNIGYEEWELFDRLADTYRMAYAPDAVVTHRVDPQRLQYDRVRRSSFQIGFGASRSGNFRIQAMPSYPRRLYRVLRGYRRALSARRRNRGGTPVDADRAFGEFDAYWKLGRDIETLLSRVPWLADQAAARLV